jgi:hypothetical protein
LNVPFSRLEPDAAGYNLGRATEISRDEVKFARFIDRLRMKFSELFLFVLEKQLIMKKVVTVEDWDQMSKHIKFKYAKDNYFSELKDTEILNDRISALNNIAPYAGKYYSHEWIRKNVLRQSDDDIDIIDKQIGQEGVNPQYNSPSPDEQGMTGGFGGGGAGGQQEGPPPKPQTSFSQ